MKAKILISLQILILGLALYSCNSRGNNRNNPDGILSKDSSGYIHFKSSGYYDVPVFTRSREAQTPKNIILMIGDGMGPAQVTAAMLANQGKLFMQQAGYTGWSVTQNVYGRITDSAAGATAMATGVKTYNKAIAVDSLGRALKSIMVQAQEKGMATGVVVNCEIVDATPASFLINHEDRNDREAIAMKLIDSPVDYIFGGGLKYFNQREDGFNLLEKWEEKGYKVVKNQKDLLEATEGKLVALLDDNGLARATERPESLMQNGLDKALELLSKNEKGFILLVEGSQIDDAGHFNDAEYNVAEVLDFDKLVGKAMHFANDNKETLIVVTADHETGGMTLVDADLNSGSLNISFSTNDHTAVNVPVFSFGPSSNLFSGTYENTEIYTRMLRALDWK